MKRFEPHPYQAYCIDRLVHDPAVGLFLDMGLGKTVITLTAVTELRYNRFAVRRCLIVAPKKVAEATWSREAAKWEHLQALRIVTVLGTRIDPAPVVEELGRAGIAVDLRRFDCLVKATDDLASRLAAGDCSGIMLTSYPAIALCLANRHPRVRAILASDASRTAADAASVGANLLILEPRRTPSGAIGEIAASFCSQGPGQCPEELKGRLD